MQENISNNYLNSEKGLKLYFEEISKYENIPFELERELIKKAQEGDRKSFLSLCRANLRFVVFVAKKYRNNEVELEDLIQAGNLGLIDAIYKYDLNQKYRLITFAYYHIKSSIRNTLIYQSNGITMTNYIYEKLIIYKRVKEKLQKKLNRDATLDEIALEMNLSLKKVKQISFFDTKTLSINALIDKKNEVEYLNILPNDNPNIEAMLEEKEKCEKVENIFKYCNLNDREINIIKLYFGFDDSPLTLEEIATFYNLTRQRISQILELALKKIRDSRYLNELIDYTKHTKDELMENELFKTNKYLNSNFEITETFSYFPEYSKEEILLVLDIIPIEYKEIIVKRYGVDLENIPYKARLSHEDVFIFETKILQEMKAKLEELRKINMILDKVLEIKKESLSKRIEKEKLNNIFIKEKVYKHEYLNLINYLEIVSSINLDIDNLTNKEVYSIIYVVSFTYIKNYNIQTLAKYLKISRSNVTSLLKKALELYEIHFIKVNINNSKNQKLKIKK